MDACGSVFLHALTDAWQGCISRSPCNLTLIHPSSQRREATTGGFTNPDRTQKVVSFNSLTPTAISAEEWGICGREKQNSSNLYRPITRSSNPIVGLSEQRQQRDHALPAVKQTARATITLTDKSSKESVSQPGLRHRARGTCLKTSTTSAGNCSSMTRSRDLSRQS